MILGMSTSTFTLLHVLISLVGIGSGLILKVPALHAMAPNGTEPPFLVAQTIVLLLFIVLGVLATKRFRGPAVVPA